MNIKEYQEFTKTTAIYPKEYSVIYCVLGLTNEAGEVAGKLKKIYRDDDAKMTPEKVADMAAELGDVMWYLTRTADELGLDLEDIIEHNVAKLKSRKERNVIGGSGDNR